MKKINLRNQTTIRSFIYNTSDLNKKAIHFYITNDTKPSWDSGTNLETIEVTPARCEICGALISPTNKEMYTKFGYIVNNVCPNCGLINNTNY